MGIHGLWGAPFLRLDDRLDLSALPEIHEEICLALTELPVDYTGGSHRSMGIVPPSLTGAERGADYGEVITAMSRAQFATFRTLADDPDAFPNTQDGATFGEEREHPLSRRQMLWLKYRFGVYFPWKVYVELIPNRYWTDKARSEGKDFTRQAKTFFPKTIDFVRKLPFASIGRCNVMGLESNDGGTVHRDGTPGEQEPAHFITFAPAGNKRLFLWDEAREEKIHVDGRAYWFDDCDYHGVEPDPFFRYSVRVDGVFRDDFLEQLRMMARAAT